jgi:hypothetical protein
MKTLRYWILRSQALSLYRRVCRLTSRRKGVDPSVARDVRNLARVEFEMSSNVTDETHMRTLIAAGNEKIKQLRQIMNLVE